MRPVLQVLVPLGLMLGAGACAGETEAMTEKPTDNAAPQSKALIQDVSVAEASAIIAEGGAVVLDVRRPDEFAAGHIDGALNVNFMADDFAAELAKLDKDAPYILHCKSGGRSAKTLAVMKEQGFQNIAHMNDGYDGWSAAQAAE